MAMVHSRQTIRKEFVVRYLCAPFSIALMLSFVSDASSQQQKRIIEREVDSKELRTDFIQHVFLSSYVIYETSDHRSGIEYVQEIRNESDVVAKKILWASAGLLVPPWQQGKPFTVKNSYEVNWIHEPKEFDASTDLGIGSVEIERVEMPDGTVRKFVKDNAPCYLPRSEVISRRFRDGYPPYRWLNEKFSDPKKMLETFHEFTDGKISLNFSSGVIFRNGKYVYQYRAQSHSDSPIYFQWLSTASGQLGALDGLMGSVSAKDSFNKELEVDSHNGPILALDVVIASTKEATLPKDHAERLEGASRIYGRFAGGMTTREGTLGLKDLPQIDEAYVFLAPALVPAER